MTGKNKNPVEQIDDIPEALRDKSHSQKSNIFQPKIIIGGLSGLVAITFLTGAIFFASSNQEKTTSSNNSNPSEEVPDVKPIVPPVVKNSPPQPDLPPVDNLLGHLSYKVAPESELKVVSANGNVRMHRGAAEKFLEMQAAAKADGVILLPLSGFRNLKEQEYLFFKVKEKMGEVTTKRAEVSAPPGYSEHHTGYAVDIGDGLAPATNVNYNFEKTAAFLWLKANAAKYSFELSFPPHNDQRISYEPWHWRFVGDARSLETFYKAKNLR